MCTCMNGSRRKKAKVGQLKTDGLLEIATQEVLPATVGFLVGRILTKQLTLFSGKPYVASVIKTAGGIVLAAQGDGLLTRMGIGLAAEGVTQLGLPMLEKAGIALLPPSIPSVYLSGTPAAQYTEPGSTIITVK